MVSSRRVKPEGNWFGSGLPSLFRSLTLWGSFIFCKEQNVAGLTSQGAADSLQRFKINSHCLALFQPPQSCMTDTGLLGQPVEGALFLSQYFIKPGHNHNREVISTISKIY